MAPNQQTQFPPSVLELIHRRAATLTLPGQRDDPYRLVLAIEGGGGRAAFAAGMALAVDELEILPCFDAVYGTSAGAWIGLWLLSGYARLGLSGELWSSAAMRRVSSPGRLLRGHPVIDTGQAVEVSRDLVPDVLTTAMEQSVPLHPLATAVQTGESADLLPHIQDEQSLALALRASAAIPFLAGPPPRLGPGTWLDGGITEYVPHSTPVRDGATHILLLRTRRASEAPGRTSWLKELAMSRYLRTHAPAVLPAWRGRQQRRTEQESRLRLAEQQPHEGCQVLQLRPPPGSPRVSLMGRDLPLLQQAIAIGRSTADAVLRADRATVRPGDGRAVS